MDEKRARLFFFDFLPYTHVYIIENKLFLLAAQCSVVGVVIPLKIEFLGKWTPIVRKNWHEISVGLFQVENKYWIRESAPWSPLLSHVLQIKLPPNIASHVELSKGYRYKYNIIATFLGS
jgi:hypothetical protein